MRFVLFLCTGNYYRSRFAEALFNHLASAAGIDWQADSAGLAAYLDHGNLGPIAPSAQLALLGRGVRLPEPIRRPRQVTQSDLVRAELVIGLYEAEHRPLFTRQFPQFSGNLEFWQVPDRPEWTPEQALPHIDERVRELLGRFTAAQRQD